MNINKSFMSEKLALSRYMNNRNRLGLGWGFGLGLFTIGYLYFGCSYIEKASKSWKEAKFEQCLYLRVPLCYEQNRCAEQTLHHLEVSKSYQGSQWEIDLTAC